MVDLPDTESDGRRELALSHVLRDAREEAAACAIALQRGERIPPEEDADESALVRRARLLANLQNFIGEDPDAHVAIQSRTMAFRRVPRARPQEDPTLAEVAAFRDARDMAMDMLEEINGISPLPATTPNLFWRGIPLVSEDTMRWAVWSPSSQNAIERAERLRQVVKRRSGWELALVNDYPSPRQLSLLWVLVGESDLKELPDPARLAARDTRPDQVRTVPLDDGTIVVLVGREVTADVLGRSLLGRPTFYRPAMGVR
jgi:hypothetical protein